MHDLNAIIARNSAAQFEHDARKESAGLAAGGPFSEELQRILEVHDNVPQQTAIEREIVILAKRLLAARDGAAWDETPMWATREVR